MTDLKLLKLKFRRIRADYTQWELAKRADVAPYLISRAERGTYTFKADEEQRIEGALRERAA